MKICWDNLENIKLTKHGNFRDIERKETYVYMDSCNGCSEPYLIRKRERVNNFCSVSCSKKGKNHPNYGKYRLEKTKQKMSKAQMGKKHHNWKGGITKKNIPFYDTYASQIEYAEKVRRNKEDENIIEVKCTYCGKWYVPKMTDIVYRIKALNGKYTNGTEYRLYCSDECKKECPIYNKHFYSTEESNTKQYSREVQPELRQMVFERDDYMCQKCFSIESLHCHHIEGIRWEPLESCDIDKCITYCKKCHKEVHEIEGCGYYDMKCKKEVI